MKSKMTSPLLLTVRGLAAVAALLLAADAARADNLKIENVKVTPRDAKTATVTFDIAWSNAWRHGSFHDAAWVFFKAKANDQTGWQPVRLAASKVVNPAGFAPGEGTPLEFVVPDDHVGMFVRLAADGNGTVSAKGVTVAVEWGTNIQHPTSNTQHSTLEGAVPPGPNAATPITDHRSPTTDLRAFGIEMAYAAEGPFYLGGNGNEWNRFHQWTGDSMETPPYLVTGPGAIPTGRRKGALWAVALQPEDGGELPAAFPNGYAAFYGVKRVHITQGQYAAFLNTLTPAQAAARYQAGGHGQWIKQAGTAVPAVRSSTNVVADGRLGDASLPYSASKPEDNCPWISWADGAAYAAWAGLRPMTDLEYEKMIRGSQEPAGGWDAGLSYWGFEGVSLGQIFERCVSVFSATGRAFAGTPGAGTPEPPKDWPRDFNDIALRNDVSDSWEKHLRTSGRINVRTVGNDRSVSPLAAWRAARSAPAGDTAMRPIIPRTFVARVPRLDPAIRLDAVPAGWGKPIATIEGLEDVFPVDHRFVAWRGGVPWGGAADLGARVYLGWDGEALLVGAEVTDDKHVNNQRGSDIWNGDAFQMGVVNAHGLHWNLGLALTTNGVALHQFMGVGDELVKTAGCVVTRDETVRTTRYGLRLPLAALKVKAGEEFGFNIMFLDGDDDKGQRYWMQMAPGISYPFQPEKYPRFTLGQ